MVIVVIDCIHLSSIIFSRRGFNLVPNNAGSYIYIRDTEVYLKLREGKNHEARITFRETIECTITSE